MRRERTFLFFLSALTSLMTGCISTESHLYTTEARYSLQVTVLGPSGPICDADVRVQIGPETIPLMTIGDGDCTYAGPYERSGEMKVTASKADLQTASTTVTIASDECHVIGQKVTLTLTPS